MTESAAHPIARFAWVWKLVLALYLATMCWACWLAFHDRGIWDGLAHFYEAAKSDPLLLFFLFDMCGAFTLVFVWILLDSRKRGIAFWRWLPFYVFFGTAGVMVYLLRAGRKSALH